MRIRKWKFFLDFEREEAWLNQQAARGLVLVHCDTFGYVFEDSAPGEYNVRIACMKMGAKRDEIAEFIRFIEDGGATHIATIHNWIYFHKKADDRPFEIYNDLDSKINQFRKMTGITALMGFGGVIIAPILLLAAIFFVQPGFIGGVTSGAGGAFGIAGIFSLMAWRRYTGRIRTLEKEREISEM
ncbi:MAG: DUF2812 domain-containing protein [Defluviitaleaceae bacterium]|nr:DUF2812 domain-containing protein [Defluviitaleaceae bacterium]